MKGRKGFTLIELLVVIAIIAVLAAILFPVFAKARRSAQLADCQSNMKQIGSALKMYLSDWDDTYPTNKQIGAGGVPTGNVLSEILLTPPGTLNADQTPRRFQYGVNWVEGLYNYVEQVSTTGATSWRCSAASSKKYPPTSATAMISYVFNYNLCEAPEGIIKGASQLMAVRENDKMMNSDLRPYNDSSSGATPLSPFLDSSDEAIGMPSQRGCSPKIHSTGSCILFADGHVKFYTQDYYPEQAQITSANSYDTESQQWFNFQGNSTKPVPMRRTIAITP